MRRRCARYGSGVLAVQVAPIVNNGRVLLLAFDTATPAVTVALRGDEGVLAEHTEVDARRHGELLAPGIEQGAGRRRPLRAPT